MVQIIDENRRPTAGERANRAVGVGLEFASKIMGQREQIAKENEYAKELGLNISGIKDPKTRQKAIELGIQDNLKKQAEQRAFDRLPEEYKAQYDAKYEALGNALKGIGTPEEGEGMQGPQQTPQKGMQSEQAVVDNLMGFDQEEQPTEQRQQQPVSKRYPPKYSQKQIQEAGIVSPPEASRMQKHNDNIDKQKRNDEKSSKEQKAVKKLLRESNNFDTEEELEEASKIYDLPTAKSIWQESKKPKSKSTTQKLLETETAKGYIAAKNEIPKLQATLENINRLKELGPKLGGPSGYVKSAFNTQSASEYNTLAASLLEPIIKIFNPVGAVPVTKLNWIRDTFSPKASDLQTTQAGKLATLERLASQAQQRAQQKIKLFEDYNGEPPESEIVKFDNDSAKMVNDFVDNQQYVEKLKKEIPKGKILMIDPNGKPLHVDPSQTMPNGMTAVEYATQFGAKVIE